VVEQGRRAHRPARRPGDGQARATTRSQQVLSSPEAKILALAFRGRLERARRLAPAGSAAARWLDAYVALCRGDFATATSQASAINDAPPPIGFAALITLGSAARQAGRHGEGLIHDRNALARATTPAQRVAAYTGIAADHVGRGEATACVEAIEAAQSHLARADRRGQVRLAWVRCEYALLTDAPDAAVLYARRALRRSRGLSPRHRVKSMLFLGVALHAAGSPQAPRMLRRAHERSQGRRGFEPLAAVARDMLGRAGGGSSQDG
jgi:hypothetical protein